MKIGVFHTAFIGDIILTGLMLETLFKAGHEIIFFTKPQTKIIYEYDSRVSKVVAVKKAKGFRKFFSIFTIAEQIKSENLDLLIAPHKSFTTSLISFFSRVKRRIGFKKAAGHFLYTDTVKFEQNEHECVRYLSLLPQDICSQDLIAEMKKSGRTILRYEKYPAVSLVSSPWNDSYLNMSSQGLTGDSCQSSQEISQQKNRTKKYFIVSVSSVWETKKYHTDYFAKMCAHILNKNEDLTCILAGGPNDKQDAEQFLKFITQYHPHVLQRVENYIGKSNLYEFGLLCKNAHFVVCNDSSPIHFASAFNTPTICFFGPTVLEFGFGPCSEKHLVINYESVFGQRIYCQPCTIHGSKVCPQKHHRCMKDLKPDLFLNSVDVFLKDICQK